MHALRSQYANWGNGEVPNRRDDRGEESIVNRLTNVPLQRLPLSPLSRFSLLARNAKIRDRKNNDHEEDGERESIAATV